MSDAQLVEGGSGGRRRNARGVLFLVSVWFKGIDGFLELIGGMALFLDPHRA